MADVNEEVTGSLRECAISMALFNLHPDVNVKLANLQHLNKAYSALQHKVDSKKVQVGEIDTALEDAKKAVEDAVEKLELKPDVRERVSRVAPNTLNQIVDNLKKNNAIQINSKVVFRQEEKPNVD